MLHFRPGRVQDLVELLFDILNQVACDFDMTDVRWIILRANIVMLHQASSVEVRDKRSSRTERRVRGVFDRVVKDPIEKIFRGVEVLAPIISIVRWYLGIWIKFSPLATWTAPI
jgi:hypothetical protein